jgi:hypothetical protein
MAVDGRSKDVRWRLNVSDQGTVSTNDAQLAVLMDIRDELQAANRTLNAIERQVCCRNATAVPRILRKIEENTQRKSRAKKVP